MRRWRILAVAGAVLLVGGGVFALLAPRSHQPPSLPVKAAEAAPSVKALAGSPEAAPIAYSVPVSLSIPSIGVSDVTVVPEGCTGPASDCVLNTPPLTGPQASDVGWWDGSSGPFVQGDGITPGQLGPAILAAHVNSAAMGALTFANLDSMKVGQRAEVTLADGAKVWFTAYAVQEVPKDTFPTAQVYGMTPGPELRLITCGGAFDSATGHYLSNLIIYARMDKAVK